MIRTEFVEAVAVAADLIRRDLVADAWELPSALEEFPVGALVGHLVRNVLRVRESIATVADAPPIPLLEHFTGDLWPVVDRDHEVHVGIRERAGSEAAAGHAALVDRLSTELALLPAALAAEPADRVVRVPNKRWCLTLDDFVLTRLVEVVVHTDDLAVSVGLRTPGLPPAAIESVIVLLTRLSIWRNGSVPVLRALSRRERAPFSITAF